MANAIHDIVVVTGTRAEYGLLKSTIDAIRASRRLRLRLLVTGMHTLRTFGRTIGEIRRDGVPIARVVPIRERDTMLAALAKEIIGIEAYCRKLRPSVIMVLGDRDEPLAGALAGAHLGIPVAHIHGGDVSGVSNVDELARHAITKLSHLHFTVSAKSRDRVIALGEEPRRVFNVGAPGLDALRRVSRLPKRRLAARLELEVNRRWLLVVQHPAPFSHTPIPRQIAETLAALDGVDAEKVIIYNNSNTGWEIFLNRLKPLRGKTGYRLFASLNRATYVALLEHCDAMVGNSSSGVLEAGFFKLPVVDIGERQRGRERGRNVLWAPYRQTAIAAQLQRALSPAFRRRLRHAVHPFGAGRAARQIVATLERWVERPDLWEKKFTYA